MQRWTERYLRTVIEWLNQQWNKPSRSDYYMMRVAQRVQQQWSKKPISIDDQKLTLKVVKTRPLSREEKIARSKAVWMGGISGGIVDGD